MIRFLLKRPIAVAVSFIVLIIFGIFSLNKIPISLLPTIDVPKIVVKITYPNTSARVIEENVTRTIRENLMSLDGLDDLSSRSTNHFAIIDLSLEYRSKMDLVYIDVNERLDRIINNLPKDLPRPQVIKISTSDVPIIRVQVSPKNLNDYLEVSELTEKVIKRRLEQIPGVSLVDLNGKQKAMITLEPRRQALFAVGLTEKDVVRAIQSSNIELGSLAIKDGQYHYFVKLTNRLETINEISNIPIKIKDGSISNVGNFVIVKSELIEPQGYHLYNGKQGLVITVHKQSNARMNELVPQVRSALNSFKKDYPKVNFNLTQDQTYLLNEAIQNLTQDLYYGGFFCVLLLFMFLGNYQAPIMMGISIPVSLVLTFIFFYLFNISFNIISLSGLALGIGMLIDNSIIVVDNITRKRREGFSIEESCVIGVREVVSPIVSNVLTTVAIYAPLIYLNGLAGELVYDQAVALSISLMVSLLIAFCLNPVMYKYLLKADLRKLKDDTKFYLLISIGYHKMINHIFNHKGVYFVCTLAVMPLGVLIFKILPVTTLPKITETERLVRIDWNKSIDAKENRDRIMALSSCFANRVEEWEVDIGLNQYILQEDNNSIDKAILYYRCENESEKMLLDKAIEHWLAQNYPDANRSFSPAPNAFTQLFESNEPYLECRFRPFKNQNIEEPEKLNTMLRKLNNLQYHKGLGMVQEPTIEMRLNYEKMSIYGVEKEDVEGELNLLFGSSSISEIKKFGDVKTIRFKQKDDVLNEKMNGNIRNYKGEVYPLKTFVSYNYGADFKYITADKGGKYKSINFEKEDVENIGDFESRMKKIASVEGYDVIFFGKYESNQTLMKDMFVVFMISVLMIYLILAVQFENLIHPLLVMGTIPLGLGGAMLLLWLVGGTMDIMAAIGLIVVLGIIVDDPSLKVETINRLRKEYEQVEGVDKRKLLLRALHDAGEICLKPLLMVSLTTSLALIPVLFTGGIGNELQKPMVYVIVGGLTIGTFLTLWFIPLAYWFITRKN